MSVMVPGTPVGGLALSGSGSKAGAAYRCYVWLPSCFYNFFLIKCTQVKRLLSKLP